MTYEGARSIVGPFLGSLGASAAIVGFVAGFGEMVGYGLRSVSGYFADKTHRYWAVAIIGYAINMLPYQHWHWPEIGRSLLHSLSLSGREDVLALTWSQER